MSSNDVKCPTHQLDSDYVHLTQYVPGHGDMVVGGNYWHTPEERCTGQWQVSGYDTHGEHGLACVSAWDGKRNSHQLGGIEPDHTMTLPSVELVVEWLTSHGFTSLETDVPALDAAWNRRPDPITADDQPRSATGYRVPVEMTVEVDGPDLDAWLANPVGEDPREVARQRVKQMVEEMIPHGFWVEHVDTDGEIAHVDAQGDVRFDDGTNY